ncbi:unnamed protein product, partial [Prorocentrum cordatum]
AAVADQEIENMVKAPQVADVVDIVDIGESIARKYEVVNRAAVDVEQAKIVLAQAEARFDGAAEEVVEVLSALEEDERTAPLVKLGLPPEKSAVS